MPERSFGRLVRYRRTKLGLSQAELGQLVGRSPATIRSWEADKSIPNDPKILTTLSAILGVDERSIFNKAGQEPPMVVEDSPTVEEALASLTSEVETNLPAPTSKFYEELEESIVEEPKRAVALAPLEDEATDQPDILIELHPTPPPSVPAPVPTPAPPMAIPTPTYPLVEASYIEDGSQRQLYHVRTLATVVGLVALVVALIWAAGEGLSALGEWWDGFISTLRL
jgi:transcriptional regulator with XRE-family HTH domain